MADVLDSLTVLSGALYRFARKHNKPDPTLIVEFELFVEGELEKFEPLGENTVDFYIWLEGTHYTQAMKLNLTILYEKMCEMPDIKPYYSSFGKKETLNTTMEDFEELFKDVRCINGLCKEWLVYIAPYISAIEHVVCKDRHFAKYIPVCDRARAIYELLSPLPGPYYVTDYTSFESSFVPKVIKACECKLIRHMLKHYPKVANDICAQMSSKRLCKFRDFNLEIQGVRMSGDPHTSLANGFTNLMLMKFCAFKQGAICEGFIEGDDGLFATNKPINFDIMGKLGFQLTLEPHEDLHDTSFCGLMLSRSLAAFADPRYVLAKFAWTGSSQMNSTKKSVLLGLLRSKALSLFYTNPRCPILTTLATRYIHLTRDVKAVYSQGFWDRKVEIEAQKFSEATQTEFDRGISIEDRLDFERLYDISPDMQLLIERDLRESDLGPIKSQAIDAIMSVRRNFAVFDSGFCGPYGSRPL